MPGMGTLINVAAIAAGGLIGLVLKNAFPQAMQETLIKAMGVCTLFIGIAGALPGLVTLEDGALASGSSMMLILSMALGALTGSLLALEERLEAFGVWLRRKTGSEQDASFLNGFLTASLTVCIGAMAVVGSIQDGLMGDLSLLAAKSVLDFIIVMMLAAALGKGCIFSAVPVGLLQGGITLLARFLEPLMTPAAVANLSTVGSVLIFCVGVNLVWGLGIKVANLLPALVAAVALALV